MKRSIALLTTLALLPFLTGAAFPFSFWKAAGGVTFTARDSVTGTAAVTNYFAFNSNLAIACQFTAGGTYTITKADISAHKVASPVYNVICAIYTNSAGAPGSLVGTASGTVNAATFSTSEATVTFTGMSASLTSGTVYWVVLYAPSGGNDFTNYTVWDSTAGGANGSFIAASPGSSWSAFQSSSAGKMTLYSTP
jgi:hypothetical protein